MPKPKRKAFTVYLTPAGERELRSRAAAHGVSMSSYVDDLVQGAAPGGGIGGEAYHADGWWFAHKPRQRNGIFEWLSREHKKRAPKDDEKQPTIFEEEAS